MAESTRKRISVRELIDASGNVVKNYSEAQGVRITVVHSGQSFDELFDTPVGSLTTMAACFGLGTKVGNVINTIVNAPDYDGSDPTPDVEEWLDQARGGQWREAVEGRARGPKYDKDVLAIVLHAALSAAGQAKGDPSAYREKLEDNSYYARVRNNPEIMAAYHKEMAERGVAKPGADLGKLA